MATEQKNVVVVGLGLGGVNAVKSLENALPATYRLVVISEKPFGFFPIASLRASVVPGWEDKTTLTNAGIFSKGSRHVLLPATKALSIGEDLHTLRVDTAHPGLGFDFEIPFEYLVLATGSTDAFPGRPSPSAKTIEDVVAAHKALQKEINLASSILIVGAGDTGIEWAGEVAAHYPGSKTVTLVSATPRLFSDPRINKKVGPAAERLLQDLGVKLVFNARVDTAGLSTGPIRKQSFSFADGTTAQVDFVILATGIKPNSELVSTIDPQAVNEAGFIKVLDTLQLVNPAYHHIFAIGDCADRPEGKSAAAAKAQTPVLVANILASINKSSSFQHHKPSPPQMIVTTGPGGGTGQIFGWFVPNWAARMIKSKGLLLGYFTGAYPPPK